jgi:hypothetical protein
MVIFLSFPRTLLWENTQYFSVTLMDSSHYTTGKKLSAKPSSPRVFYLSFGIEKTLGKQPSLPRAKQKALGTEKTFAKDFLPRANWLAKNFFAKCNFFRSRQRNF